MDFRSYTARSEVTLPTGQPDDSFHLYHRTEPVVILYRTGRHIHGEEDNHGGRMMRLIDRMGREGIQIRGVYRGQYFLDPSSLRALNLFLQHGRGLSLFRRVSRFHCGRHRYGWQELQELLNLRWVFYR